MKNILKLILITLPFLLGMSNQIQAAPIVIGTMVNGNAVITLNQAALTQAITQAVVSVGGNSVVLNSVSFKVSPNPTPDFVMNYSFNMPGGISSWRVSQLVETQFEPNGIGIVAQIAGGPRTTSCVSQNCNGCDAENSGCTPCNPKIDPITGAAKDDDCKKTSTHTSSGGNVPNWVLPILSGAINYLLGLL